MEFKSVLLKNIKPNPANPRIIKDDAYLRLKKSIAQFPQMLEVRPIAVSMSSGTAVAIGGNQRYKALIDIECDVKNGVDIKKELGASVESENKLLQFFKSGVPVVICDGFTEDQVARFIIADNVPFGEWDFDELSRSWDLDDVSDWGVNAFKGGEFEDINESDFGTGFSLPDGDKQDIEQMTFTFSGKQAGVVKNAISEIKKTDDYKYCETFGNENSNGNALYLIINQWEGQKK